MSQLKVDISSPPDRNRLVANVMTDTGAQVAELSCESGPLKIEIYPCPIADAWVLDVDQLIVALREAAERLRERYP